MARAASDIETTLPTPARTHLGAFALVATILLAFGAGAAGASQRSSLPPSFRWLVPAPAPAGWKHLSLPSSGAVLSFPPALRRISADPSAISVDQLGPHGLVLAYLNVTPRQGAEALSTWPAFRVRTLREESASSVRELAHGLNLTFLGGTGSCVIDSYVTRIKSNHYHEIACYVQGHAGANVVIAAASESQWAQVAPQLERALAAYQAT